MNDGAGHVAAHHGEVSAALVHRHVSPVVLLGLVKEHVHSLNVRFAVAAARLGPHVGEDADGLLGSGEGEVSRVRRRCASQISGLHCDALTR